MSGGGSLEQRGPLPASVSKLLGTRLMKTYLKKNEKGLTLVELIIVVAIVAILGTSRSDPLGENPNATHQRPRDRIAATRLDYMRFLESTIPC